MKSPQHFLRWKHLAIAGLMFGWVHGLVELSPELSNWHGGHSALAQSGGRTRGGSFDRPSSPSQAPSSSPNSGGGYTSPSYDYSSPYDYSYPPSRPDYFPGSYRRPRVIVMPPQSYPVPVDPGYGYGYGTGGSSGDGLFLFLIMACGICILPVLMSYMRASQGNSRSSKATGELANDVMTVTQLQIALLAQARDIQAALTQLSLQANLDTQAGLADFLRETVLALLRSPEYWSHARVSSQTVKSRAQASQLFEQLSIQERSKLSAETLVNVGGNIRRQTVQVNQDADPASYIVVTLLIGTADDKPLAASVHSAAELNAILKRLGSVSSDYLMVYELIWSPQDASDSLSRDQLLAGYSDLVQIA